jgi:predicted Zn-dependent protease
MFRKKLTIIISISLLLLWDFFSTSQLYAFSIKEEREYGQKMLAVIRSEFDLLDQPDFNQYINKLGHEIVSIAGNQYFDYHFYVINNRDFNAFASPSGLIFMHSGLLETMDNEGELHSVLAHEIGHVVSRHIADRVENSTKINAVTLAMVLAGIALGGGALSQALVTGGLATGAALGMAFTRQDEEEADRKAYTYMLQAQRDPQDMVTMLKKMYKVNQLNMGEVPQYLLTHPKPELRMGYVEDLIHTNQPGKFSKADQFEFNRIKCRVKSYTKQPEQLVVSYRKKIRTADNDFERLMATYGLALAYYDQAEYGKAEAELKKVIAAYPQKTILLSDLGLIYFKSGRLQEAKDLFDKARNLDPGDWYASYNLAVSLTTSGDDERALALYKQLVGSMPDFSGGYFQIAGIYSRQGKQDLSHLNLGRSFYFKGQFKPATYHLEKALELLAADPAVVTEVGEMMKIMKDLK